ncbi:MAG: c-type cytochrome [Bryobacterales bacterium]|nr:c-type cytochrome [Bryobacterales bacterium]
MPVERKVQPDPITTKSYSVHLLVSMLLLTASLVWAVYDEVEVMRPYKDYQARFRAYYTRFLAELQPQQAAKQQAIRQSPEYQELNRELTDAEQQVMGRIQEIDRITGGGVVPRMTAARNAFQVLRSEIDALRYQIEVSDDDAEKDEIREEIEEIRARIVEVDLPLADGSGDVEEREMRFEELEQEFLSMQQRRVDLQAERLELLERANELRGERDGLMADRLPGLGATQIDGLLANMANFEIGIKQIHLLDIDLVDRCESCHLGIREPVEIGPTDLLYPVFRSHPRPDLLAIHDPEAFGCSSCHNGNGRATRSVTKGHGRHKFWLWPLFYPENVEAGCQQCHAKEIVTPGGETLNHGRELYMNKGCWGCHRFEGFDAESEELTAIVQQLRNLEANRDANAKEMRESIELGDTSADGATAQRYYARAEELRLTNSRIDAEIHNLGVERTNLAEEVKKFGPSLKEIKVKDVKEWIPEWIKNPHEFRPGSKMPVFRLLDEEVQQISAYLWQNALDGDLRSHPMGNSTRGKELFETRGCMGCHSIGEGDSRVGGTFAANLSRVGEKMNYDYMVRWIHDPSEVTPDPDVPDELRPRPVMPSLRLTEAESRDIAAYLSQQRTDQEYPPAPYMDDPQMAEAGLVAIRHYGCAGCHEISGLEEEGRIGTDLTVEGSKPLDRLDFALKTHEAEMEGWHSHKGFFERKLENPAFFDEGKEREHLERLRMPNFNLSPDEITALTTFLLGAVETVFPEQYRFEPEDERAAVQEGWWIITRHNCNGCHQIRPGNVSAFMTIPRYTDDPDWAEQLPPQLYTQGARVQPEWLSDFLHNPALSETATNRNGVRRYLEARMPTFYFSDRQVSKLTKFFMARDSQPVPDLPESMEPLTPSERAVGRQLFTSDAAPCLDCHMTGIPSQDVDATAPNFLIAAERLKPNWTFRWLLEPASIAPGTAMPSGLFERDGDRWVFAGQIPAQARNYAGDHADLLTRYMFQMDAAELARLRALQ